MVDKIINKFEEGRIVSITATLPQYLSSLELLLRLGPADSVSYFLGVQHEDILFKISQLLSLLPKHIATATMPHYLESSSSWTPFGIKMPKHVGIFRRRMLLRYQLGEDSSACNYILGADTWKFSAFRSSLKNKNVVFVEDGLGTMLSSKYGTNSITNAEYFGVIFNWSAYAKYGTPHRYECLRSYITETASFTGKCLSGSEVWVIGQPLSRIARETGISLTEFFRALETEWLATREVRYIPHKREKEIELEKYVPARWSVERLEYPVEAEILRGRKVPDTIVGMFSSALLTIPLLSDCRRVIMAVPRQLDEGRSGSGEQVRKAIEETEIGLKDLPGFCKVIVG